MGAVWKNIRRDIRRRSQRGVEEGRGERGKRKGDRDYSATASRRPLRSSSSSTPFFSLFSLFFSSLLFIPLAPSPAFANIRWPLTSCEPTRQLPNNQRLHQAIYPFLALFSNRHDHAVGRHAYRCILKWPKKKTDKFLFFFFSISHENMLSQRVSKALSKNQHD